MHNSHLIQWDKLYEAGNDYAALSTQDVATIVGYVSEAAPRTALDIGCGTGQACRELFHRGFSSVGIDISVQAVEAAKKSTRFSSDEIQFINKDIMFTAKPIDLPFAPYGIIVCKYVYAFIVDRDGLLEKVKTILHKDGVFVLISPDLHSLPKEKQGIGVDHKTTLAKLRHYFKVIYQLRNKDHYYICKNTARG